MKTLSLFFLFFMPLLAISQDTLITYYDSDWNEIKKAKKAVFYRKLYQISDDTWQAKDYFKTGELQMTGQYVTNEAKLKKGTFTYYYFNGQIKSTGSYINNKEVGEWQFFYENGKLKRKAIYDAGDWVSSNTWDENDSLIVDEKLYDYAEINPEFPGGNDSLVAFIQREFSYPEKAREKGEEGTVYVEFVVQKDGRITDVKTVLSASKSLDAEAERVVKAMPRWHPGEQAGDPVNVRYTMPFKCKLAEEDKPKKYKR